LKLARFLAARTRGKRSKNIAKTILKNQMFKKGACTKNSSIELGTCKKSQAAILKNKGFSPKNFFNTPGIAIL